MGVKDATLFALDWPVLPLTVSPRFREEEKAVGQEKKGVTFALGPSKAYIAAIICFLIYIG